MVMTLRFVSLFLVFALMAFMFMCLFPMQSVSAEVITNATVNGWGVNVRSSDSTASSLVTVLYCGHRVQITGPLVSVEWYPVTFIDLDSVEKTGYISASYLLLDATDPIDPASSFEISISGFPESYKNSLRALHQKYPNWVFVPYVTNLDFNTVLSEEANESSSDPRSLIENTVNDAWQSAYTRNDASLPGWAPYIDANSKIKYDAYNWLTDTYVPYDASRWVKASKDYVAYALDPRNFLSDTQIFQFFKLSYDSDTQNVETVQKMLSTPVNSFMSTGIIQNYASASITYAQAIMDAAIIYKVNPYFLVTRIKQEILKSDGQPSATASGNYPGFEGYYNFYNIAAVSGSDPIRPALFFAKGGSGSTPDTTFYRPWNSPYKAILGGAEWIVSGYISRGQDTLYFQKFDMIQNADGLYGHQYMTSIQAPVSEARRLRDAYNELTDLPLLFSIPVYNNMPECNVQLPACKGNPNNWITSISLSGQALTPSFDPNNLDYDLIVGSGVSSVDISIKRASTFSTITGITLSPPNPATPLEQTGSISLNPGQNEIPITCVSQSGVPKTYNISIFRMTDNGAPLFTSSYTLFDQYLSGISEQMTVPTFLSGLTLVEGARAEMTDRIGALLTDPTRIMKTGDRLLVYDSAGALANLYTIVLYGDPSGDGRINSYDMTITARHIIKELPITGVEFIAADVDKSGKINSMDMTMIARHIIKETILPQ